MPMHGFTYADQRITAENVNGLPKLKMTFCMAQSTYLLLSKWNYIL